jgi:hypothetical protein
LEERVFVSKRGRTECHELQNYGKIFTGKLSARVLMALFTAVPKELGFIGTPKFLTKIQDMFGEIGYRHVAFISCDALRVFITDLCRDLGGISRESAISARVMPRATGISIGTRSRPRYGRRLA